MGLSQRQVQAIVTVPSQINYKPSLGKPLSQVIASFWFVFDHKNFHWLACFLYVDMYCAARSGECLGIT